MKILEKLYTLALQVKVKAIIYTVAFLFFMGVTQLVYHQNEYVSLWHLLEIFLVTFLAATIEYFYFKKIKNSSLAIIIWLFIMNFLFIGGSCFFGWFTPLPTYVYVILVIFLQFGLLVFKLLLTFLIDVDTRQLNDKLKQFQQR